ncbi:MAG TPA: 6-hydroxymethylpterin diphosphokinase MptE-like protein [Halothiobacillus sp.]|nr:6-hydroxymethylpterin diphosphokinase MptE-like protein [Halothiobacillus sp.]
MTDMPPATVTIPDHLTPGDNPQELVQTQAGDWIFPALNGLHFSPSAEQTIIPGTSPAQQALQAHFRNRLHQQDRLYVMIGSDSGQLIRFVQEKSPLPRGSRWLFIEPEPLASILKRTPAVAALLDDYVHLITPEEWDEATELLLLNDYFRINGVAFERSLAALDHPTPDYLELVDQFDAELTRRRYVVTANLGTAPFLNAQLANTPSFFANLVPLKGIFKGKKALILAGGPSLDDQIDWIKANRSRLFLIAVSRISARLLAVDIHPDLIATVDPYPVSLTVSRHMFGFGPQTILVAGNHAYPGIVNRWPHRMLHTDLLLPWDEPVSPDEQDKPAQTINPVGNLVSVGPTVTHTCVMLATYLGFTEIAFAGLDLCHAPDGQTHAQGSSEAAAGPLLDYTAVKVTTNRGQIAWTTPDYFAGIETLESMAEHLMPQGVSLINPSPNAAAIKGVRFQPLEEIDWPAGPFDRRPLDAAVPVSAQAVIDHLTRVQTALKTMAEQVQKIENLAQLALESNRAFFNMINPDRQSLHQRRMRAIDRLMRARLPEAEHLVKTIAHRELVATDLPHDFFALDAQQAEALANRFYNSIQLAAKNLQPVLSNIDFRLETRLMEQDRQQDPALILARYVEGKEPERVLWLATNWALPTQITAEAAEIFDAQMTKLLAADQKRNEERRSPKASLRLAEMHFSQHNGSALASLAQALTQHPDTRQAPPYAAYLRGLLAELNHEPSRAMTAYEHVLNQADSREDQLLLDHCLIRTSAVSLLLDDPVQANQALDTAALFNPSHWALSGQLASLRGDYAHAIEAYSHYLARFPGDPIRIRQIATLFNTLGIDQGIEQCLALVTYCNPADQPHLKADLNALRGESPSPASPRQIPEQ